MRVHRLLLIAAPLVALAVDGRAHADVGLIEILTGFSAKETCSCAFVVEQDDAYCKAFGQQSGFEVILNIDHTSKVVTATVDPIVRTAHFVDGEGCTLDPLK